MAHHAELLDAAYWQGHKESIQAGHVHDVFPYEPGKRFTTGRYFDPPLQGEHHV
jgi:isocitrate dehydrogenase kinase/phosphatase